MRFGTIFVPGIVFFYSSVILKTVVCHISYLRRCIMARNVAIGIQQYNELIEKNYFYIDKTSFIKEWWDSGDSVKLDVR